jgi:hypothetical protein
MFLVEALAAVAGVTAGVAAAIVAVAAVLAVAAYDVIVNWRRFAGFFEEMGQGLIDIFSGLTDFLVGVFTGNFRGAIQGIKRIGHGVAEFFIGLWDVPKQLFLDFVETLDKWTGGRILSVFHSIGDAVSHIVAKIQEWFDLLTTNPVGRLLGLSHMPQMQPPGAGASGGPSGGDAPGGGSLDPTGGSYLMPSLSGQITVGVDPNNGKIAITRTETSSPGFSILNTLVDPGLALAIP